MDPNQHVGGKSDSLWELSPHEASDEDLLARYRAMTAASFNDSHFFEDADRLEWVVRLTKIGADAREKYQISLLCSEVCAHAKLPTSTTQSDVYTALESREGKFWSPIMISLLTNTASYAEELKDFKAVCSCNVIILVTVNRC